MTSNIPGAMRSAFRQYVTDGVPGSGINQPSKGEIAAVGITIGGEVDALATAQSATNALIAALTSIGAAGMIGYATKSAMDADLLHADGTLAQVSYATDPVNAGTYKKSGASGAGSWVSFPTAVDVLGPDIPKLINISTTASDGVGNGSQANPYSYTDGIASINADTSRRSLTIILKDGLHRGPAMQFDVSKWKEITIRSLTGKNITLMASRFIAPGTAAFTQPDAAGAPNVWMIDNKYLNVSGSVLGVAQLIDLDATQACGRTGVNRAGATLYGNLGNNVTAATMNSIIYRTGFSLQTAGPNTGKLFVHARNSLNPNTINFEQTIYDFCLLFYGLLGTNWNACRVNISGVRGSFAGGAAFWADRCQLDWENCEAELNPGYGFQANQCWGELASCHAIGNGADGFNGSASFPDASVLDRNVRLRLQSCKSFGNVQYVTPPVGSAVVGDGFSNHNSQSWELLDCYAIGATKDGASMLDTCKFTNFVAEDCATAGITFASQFGKAIKAEVFGGRFSGNTYGIQVNANGTVETATLDAYGTIIENNVTASIILTGNRPSFFNDYGIRVRGAVPASGHQVNSSTDGTSAFSSKSWTLLNDAAPVTKTGAASSTGDATSLIFNANALHTHTLPAAASFPGREIYCKSIAAFAVNSASANVVPLAGGAATTAILAATAGKWAVLKSDGTSWVMMSAG